MQSPFLARHTVNLWPRGRLVALKPALSSVGPDPLVPGGPPVHGVSRPEWVLWFVADAPVEVPAVLCTAVDGPPIPEVSSAKVLPCRRGAVFYLYATCLSKHCLLFFFLSEIFKTLVKW